MEALLTGFNTLATNFLGAIKNGLGVVYDFGKQLFNNVIDFGEMAWNKASSFFFDDQIDDAVSAISSSSEGGFGEDAVFFGNSGQTQEGAYNWGNAKGLLSPEVGNAAQSPFAQAPKFPSANNGISLDGLINTVKDNPELSKIGASALGGLATAYTGMKALDENKRQFDQTFQAAQQQRSEANSLAREQFEETKLNNQASREQAKQLSDAQLQQIQNNIELSRQDREIARQELAQRKELAYAQMQNNLDAQTNQARLAVGGGNFKPAGPGLINYARAR